MITIRIRSRRSEVNQSLHYMSCFFMLLACQAVVGSNIGASEPSVIDHSEPLLRIDSDFELADGAGWDGRGRLYVPDVKGKKLLAFDLRDPKAPPTVRHSGAAISGCCYQLGKLFISDNGNSRISVLDKNGPPKTLAKLDPKNRPNDLVVDANGNVYVTITREGVVRRIDSEGEVDVVMENLVTPNGIALSPDGTTLYVSSAKEGSISKATITSHTTKWTTTQFAQLTKTENGFRGDGMCVDRAGNVYCTGAEAVTVFNPQGSQIGQIKTPERPINAIIGGVDGRTLYISTFGGLYAQRVRAYGVSPNPPELDPANGATSTSISPAPSTPSDIRSDLNIVYATIDGRKLLMDVFQPSTNTAVPKPAIVVVHGGGWAKGDKTKFRELSVRLAKRGWVTAAIEYRLAMESKFPTAIRDCNAATSFLRENASRWGIDPNRIGAVGGSAGGHLVGLMAAGSANEKLRHPSASEASPKLKAAVVMAGPLEIATGSVAERSHDHEKRSNAVVWIGDTIENNSKMYSLADAYEKIDAETAPILFIAGSLDNPSRNERARSKLKQHGVETQIIVHPNAKHGHWNHPDWIGQVVADIDSFLAKHL